jgi:hypothetical protein
MTTAKPMAETVEAFLENLSRRNRCDSKADIRAREVALLRARDAELLAPLRELLRRVEAQKATDAAAYCQIAEWLRACLPPEAEDTRKDKP